MELSLAVCANRKEAGILEGLHDIFAVFMNLLQEPTIYNALGLIGVCAFAVVGNRLHGNQERAIIKDISRDTTTEAKLKKTILV
jgi:hypothetical protein